MVIKTAWVTFFEILCHNSCCQRQKEDMSKRSQYWVYDLFEKECSHVVLNYDLHICFEALFLLFKQSSMEVFLQVQLFQHSAVLFEALSGRFGHQGNTRPKSSVEHETSTKHY